MAVKRLLNTGVDIDEREELPLDNPLLANLRKVGKVGKVGSIPALCCTS